MFMRLVRNGAMSLCAALVVLLARLPAAHADAVLQSPTGNVFPATVAVSVQVRAQVELTTLVFDFGKLADRGDHVLTVPSPDGAYPVGVDLDRGTGFVQLPIKAEAPPPPASGGSSTAAIKGWLGQTPLTSRLRDLAPGPLKLRVRFLRLLRRHQGKVSFLVGVAPCPLRQAADGVASATLTVNLRAARPLVDISTQGTPAKLQKDSPTEATLTVAKTLLASPLRLELSYEEQTKGIHARFLAHRTPTADPLGGKAGYFLLLLDADNVSAKTTRPRTLSLVIDRSGSMSGDKLEQARKAALAMLDNLREGDRFNMHSFNQQISSWSTAPQPANTATVAAARTYANALTATGSTDLNNGIITGLGGKACPSGGNAGSRYDAMILLSDGQATAGVTTAATIHKNSILHNCNESRIFTFAVGYGADVPLLEAISRSARGRNFVLNQSQAASGLARAARQLFEDIYAVRVTDLSLSLTGLSHGDVLPEQAPDLFNGGQVVLVGRYQTPGQGLAKLSGLTEGGPWSTSLSLQAPALQQDNGFIKYVWATEKVGQLLAAMGRGGDTQKLKKQITDLGLAYRIQTPYTSFSTPPAGGGTSGSGSSGTGGSGTGGSYSGGFSGSGDVSLLTLLALLAGLVPLARRRMRG